MRTVAIIQARTGSTRLKNKVLADICGKPMLQRVLERVSRAEMLDEVILATTVLPEDDALVSLAVSLGVSTFRGSVEDVLGRYYHAAITYCADPVVRVTGDCPLIDHGEIDRAIRSWLGWSAFDRPLDYYSNSIPAEGHVDGLEVEVFSLAALERAHREARLPDEREHVTPYFRNSGKFAVGGGPFVFPKVLLSVKLSVDTLPDLLRVRDIYVALGEEPDIPGIVAYFQRILSMPVAFGAGVGEANE